MYFCTQSSSILKSSQGLWAGIARSFATSYIPMDKKTISIIKATAPVVAPHVMEITTTFYRTMFANNPESLAFFNKSHQKHGSQPQALADAVVAYASNIDSLDELGDAVNQMAHRHCALSVTPNLYPIVHDNMMLAISKVLGDAVTPEIGEAWSNAVNALAEILIGAEENLYKEAEMRSGGWRLQRDFFLSKKEQLGPDTVQFEFSPIDGKTGPNGFDFSAGQYITLRIPGIPDIAPRHYTVTSPIGASMLQCTTRIVPGGTMSTYMHSNEFAVGAPVQMGSPFGIFTPDKLNYGNVAFVTAGIGITPAFAHLQQLDKDGQMDRVRGALHVDRTKDHDIFRAHFGVDSFTYYTDQRSTMCLDNTISDFLETTGTDTHFVLCGPMGFMCDVAQKLNKSGANNVHTEVFGTGGLRRKGSSCPVN